MLLFRIMSSKANEKSAFFDENKQRAQVFLEAVRCLVTCGRYNEQKFEDVQRILSRVGANHPLERKQEILRQVPYLMLTSPTGNPWDRFQTLDYKNLTEMLDGIIINLQFSGSSDAPRFLAWMAAEIEEIERLIGENKRSFPVATLQLLRNLASGKV
jgi:hypothetical protein